MNDTIKDFLPLITIIGTLVTVYFALRNGRRTDRKDATTDARALAQIETKLDTVQRGVESIQLDFKAQQRQLNEISDRVARVEESSKSAHRRIDEIRGKDAKGD